MSVPRIKHLEMFRIWHEKVKTWICVTSKSKNTILQGFDEISGKEWTYSLVTSVTEIPWLQIHAVEPFNLFKTSGSYTEKSFWMMTSTFGFPSAIGTGRLLKMESLATLPAGRERR